MSLSAGSDPPVGRGHRDPKSTWQTPEDSHSQRSSRPPGGYNRAAALRLGLERYPAPSGPQISSDDRDRWASQQARAALSGEVSEDEVRWDFVVQVLREGIAADVAWRWGRPRRVSETAAADMATVLQDKLAALIVGADEPDPLRLELIAEGHSLCGWARQFCLHAAPYLAANLNAKAKRRGDVSLGEFDDDHSSVAGRGPVGVSEVDRAAEAAMCALGLRQRNLRSCGLVHLRADVVCSHLGLPAPPRLIDDEGHETLALGLQAAAEHPTAARHQVREVTRRWANWSEAQRAQLDEMDIRVALTLAVASVTPKPPPQRKALTILQRSLTAVIGGRQASRLIRVWSDTVSELDRSEFSPTGSPQVKAVEQRRVEEAAFAVEARRLINAGVTMFGTTPQAMSASLAQGLARAEMHLAAA